jgi:pantoate--beta-alanine ligase
MTGKPLPIARTLRELRMQVARWRTANLSVGFVPTMGALHDGHLSLVRLIKARFDVAVASIFVNPKQFAENEDLATYPRDEAGDAAKLASAGCDLLYAPSAEVMYPPGHATMVSMGGPAQGLEADARPHFFSGVCTVVTKLMLQCLPDAAAFGEKDFQQLMVIRRLAADLDLPVEVLAGETLREPDGLAMSSRNVYLSADERRVAGMLNAILAAAVAELEAGQWVSQTLVKVERRIFDAGFADIDYVAVRSDEDFSVIASPIVRRPARLLAAVRLGKTRLIDNLPVRPSR